jgi:uncharacterized protein (TIGR00159 family)
MASLEWVDWTYLSGALDVLVVYLLIYRTLLMVRGTRAEPMLLGLGIVVLVYIASRVLHLATLNWILGNFLGSVILVIMVLFQEDMRRALIKVGLIPGFGSDAPTAWEVSIREISQAAAELSSRRIGGLIVIRRDVGLEDYIESAVKIDALVGHQILVSIFLPTSPLHDGAVIIEGDRIVAAGAVLPLTFSPSVSKSYGTRHRAAIGLSERSDALIVVVSEETGTISLIREGRISRDLEEKTLFGALHRLMFFRQQRRNRKRSFLGEAAAPAEIAAREIKSEPVTAPPPALEPDKM